MSTWRSATRSPGLATPRSWPRRCCSWRPPCQLTAGAGAGPSSLERPSALAGTGLPTHDQQLHAPALAAPAGPPASAAGADVPMPAPELLGRTSIANLHGHASWAPASARWLADIGLLRARCGAGRSGRSCGRRPGGSAWAAASTTGTPSCAPLPWRFSLATTVLLRLRGRSWARQALAACRRLRAEWHAAVLITPDGVGAAPRGGPCLQTHLRWEPSVINRAGFQKVMTGLRCQLWLPLPGESVAVLRSGVLRHVDSYMQVPGAACSALKTADALPCCAVRRTHVMCCMIKAAACPWGGKCEV